VAVKPKTQRMWIVIITGICLLGIAAIVTTIFRDNLVFFFSPTEIKERASSGEFPPDRRIRIGGLVEEGSFKQSDESLETEFLLTDLSNNISVLYHGMLPPLFREGQGIVAEGYYKDGKFEAKSLLTKHDEKYMPPEVAEALKKSGQWQGEK